MSVNISNFVEWFITQFVNIGTQIINIIDGIIIYNNVSLLDLIIAIAIIGIFLELILTIPQNSMSKAERNVKEYKAEQKKEKYKRGKRG